MLKLICWALFTYLCVGTLKNNVSYLKNVWKKLLSSNSICQINAVEYRLKYKAK